ncbi:HAD-IIIA family hydrolase [Pollutibacter soli]|uniref:D-glycero-alpha-D-manno-heptose-1,7-bisphosphate 7-phosphatase n=1 Tax=Pollutibacter soli TaxID=3034157 RepID=UPI003013C3AF
MGQDNFILPKINKEWSLFLDRDGVINIEKEDDYVRNSSEFRFCFNAPKAIGQLTAMFGRIFIVTNQRGVSKGLMTENDLIEIHQGMLKEIQMEGGSIDRIYYCIDLESTSPNRKPNPGMGLQAVADFPAVDFNKSIMVGNAMSDMEFGKNLHMLTIFIPSGKPMLALPNSLIDAVFPDLFSLAKALQKKKDAQ